jgi:hypothetical protein
MIYLYHHHPLPETQRGVTFESRKLAPPGVSGEVGRPSCSGAPSALSRGRRSQQASPLGFLFGFVFYVDSTRAIPLSQSKRYQALRSRRLKDEQVRGRLEAPLDEACASSLFIQQAFCDSRVSYSKHFAIRVRESGRASRTDIQKVKAKRHSFARVPLTLGEQCLAVV